MGAFGEGFRREETPILENGDYRVEIVSAEEAISKTSGKPMIVFAVRPNGSNVKIKNYLVQNEYFNRNATSIFDSFNIEEGNFDLLTWVGAVGAAKIVTDDNGYLKVKYWINKKRAESLPEWQGEMPQRQTVTEIGGTGFAEIQDDDVPF